MIVIKDITQKLPMETNKHYHKLSYKFFLQRNLEEYEVLRCLKLCAMDKTLGPDGITMGFYIKMLEIVKHDIMKPFQNFHEHEVLERSFNNTFIYLIPKKKGVTKLRDFRPISLIG